MATHHPRALAVVPVLAVLVSLPAGVPAAAQQKSDPNSPVDLVLVSCQMPGTVTIGRKFQVRDEVENAGESGAAESVTIFFLSTDNVLDEKDVAIRGRRVPPLGPWQRHAQSTTITLEREAPGTWYLIAVADGQRRVDERHEGNNTFATKFTLVAR